LLGAGRCCCGSTVAHARAAAAQGRPSSSALWAPPLLLLLLRWTSEAVLLQPGLCRSGTRLGRRCCCSCQPHRCIRKGCHNLLWGCKALLDLLLLLLLRELPGHSWLFR
jgi:hypothetical protein